MSGKMKLASWNVNGIRACVKKGFLDWLEKEKADVICIQETKAQPEQLDKNFLEHKKYNFHFGVCDRKGYSGVATLLKNNITPINIIEGIGKKKFDIEGRTLTIELEKFFIINCYFPNGGREHERVRFKMQYCKEIELFIKNLQSEKNKPVIICGDFNTAHEEIDLKNPKTNQNTTGFLPIERKWVTNFIKSGFTDVFRQLHPQEPDHYTWWTYRGDCRSRNVGWRIDYFFVQKMYLKHVKKSYHRPEVLGSDHCPVILELN